MATLEPAALRQLADSWEDAIDSASKRDDAATFAGIVGDAAHRRDGGYHISRQDQPSDNYSVADFAEDREGRSDLASAVDMTMLPADMIVVTWRLYNSWRDQADPRLNHCRGINGYLGPGGPLGDVAVRFDCQSGELEQSSDDHKWHIHLEIIRKWADDPATMRDILAVITNQTHTGDDMALMDDPDFRAMAWRVEALVNARTQIDLHVEDRVEANKLVEVLARIDAKLDRLLTKP